MYPVKYNGKIYNDKRGYLKEITPQKINNKFIYSILTNSKKNVLRGMHFNKKMDEEKLIYILNGKILDITINLNKGKNFINRFVIMKIIKIIIVMYINLLEKMEDFKIGIWF